MIRVSVNGTGREVAPGTTLAELLEVLGLRPGTFAVEVNEGLVPRAEHASLRLADGDRIEIVTLVGGG